MKPSELKHLERTGIEAALAAGKVIRKYFGKKFKVTEKENAGLVTEVDLESEQKCLRIFKRETPDFGILAEELSTLQPESRHAQHEARWVIDPLDGTTNFVHGFPMFCVSIGAEVKGQIVLGVIYHPILDELYVGTQGGGAFLIPGAATRSPGKRQKLQVSRTRQLENSLLTTGFAYQHGEHLHPEMRAFERLTEVARAIRRPGSAALDLAYTARGVFDGFWERGLSPWDTAAGSLLVLEAGGKVTDFTGEAFDVNERQVLATNRVIHGAVLQMIAPDLCPI